MSAIKQNIDEVMEKIEKAAERVGRSPGEIRLMAVSKTKPLRLIEDAYNAGQRLFGENRVQEAYDKFLNFHGDAELHIIGHLQSNKARKAAEIASCVQSVDKFKTAAELEKRCAALEKQLDIYLEFNTSGEDSKSGYRSKDQLLEEIERIAALPHLKIRGLMTIGPLNGDDREIRKAFAVLRELFLDLRRRYPELPLEVLSMGMSSDYEIAVEEGSTMVRVGTALFGAR
jgi:hypothetical protein